MIQNGGRLLPSPARLPAAGLWVAGPGQHLLLGTLVGSGLGSASLPLYFGVVIFAQRLVVLSRARAHGLVPDSPVPVR